MDFFTLNDLVYAVNLQDKVVILDLQLDAYIFLDQKSARALKKYILSGKSDNQKIHNLIDNKIIKLNNETRNSYQSSSTKTKSITIEMEDRMKKYLIKDPDINSINKIDCVLIWFFLIFVSIICRLGKMSLFFKFILSKRQSLNAAVDIKEIKKIAETVKYASQFMLHKVSCLEWAIACVFLGSLKKIQLDLCIGIQDEPFRAHAWVEYSGISVDDCPWRDSLYLIFSSDPSRGSMHIGAETAI